MDEKGIEKKQRLSSKKKQQYVLEILAGKLTIANVAANEDLLSEDVSAWVKNYTEAGYESLKNSKKTKRLTPINKESQSECTREKICEIENGDEDIGAYTFETRVERFRKTIEDFGITRLYNELIRRYPEYSSYKFNSFSTDYKRLKKFSTGLLHKTELLDPIFTILKYRAYDVFGGLKPDIETTILQIDDVVERAVARAITAQTKGNQQKKKIFAQIFNSAQFIFQKNQFLVSNLSALNFDPIHIICFHYEIKEKYGLDHSDLARKIVTLIESGKNGQSFVVVYKELESGSGIHSEGMIGMDYEIGIDKILYSCLILAHELNIFLKLLENYRKKNIWFTDISSNIKLNLKVLIPEPIYSHFVIKLEYMQKLLRKYIDRIIHDRFRILESNKEMIYIHNEKINGLINGLNPILKKLIGGDYIPMDTIYKDDYHIIHVRLTAKENSLLELITMRASAVFNSSVKFTKIDHKTNSV